MRIHLILFLSLFAIIQGQAQDLYGMGTRWNDSFREWILYGATEEEDGYLRLNFPLNDELDNWEYRMGEAYGNIKLKWRGNPNEWELRGDNVIVTARTVWPGNFQEWRISDGSCTITLRPRYGNILEEWETRTSGCGGWVSYTSYQGDPRDWVVEYELDTPNAFQLSLMAAFISTFHSTPKN